MSTMTRGQNISVSHRQCREIKSLFHIATNNGGTKEMMQPSPSCSCEIFSSWSSSEVEEVEAIPKERFLLYMWTRYLVKNGQPYFLFYFGWLEAFQSVVISPLLWLKMGQKILIIHTSGGLLEVQTTRCIVLFFLLAFVGNHFLIGMMEDLYTDAVFTKVFKGQTKTNLI